jgi:hypothetical protein
MFVYTAAYERSSLIITSMLSLLTWIYIRPSILATQVLCVNTYNFLAHIRLPALPRLTTTNTTQPFTWAFYPPVATQPIPPADVMLENRPAYETQPVQEEIPDASTSDLPLPGNECQRVCQESHADSYCQLIFHFSG